MTDNALKNIKVEISDDSMTASLYLSSAPDAEGNSTTEEFTVDNILTVLSDCGVKAGIDKKLIQTICSGKLFDREHVVAFGHPALNGQDGYFVYHFRQKLDNKPMMLPDGSVDYHKIAIYEPVKAGDLIAEYIPPTPAHFGYNVRGGILSAIPGKGLNPLKGKGFTVSDDKLNYYSDLNGKIEMINNEVIISNILDINGDVDFTTGHIVFDGDLMVHGNVVMGASINVSGNVTILGNVEAADIKAGGNIEMKSGMQGGGKGKIECGGEVWGKFFELTTLKVHGDIHANSMMNCDVNCDGNIYVSGKHGIIVGGQVSCQGNVEATIIGNMAGVRTYINSGVNSKALNEIQRLETIIADLNAKALKLKQVLDKLLAIKNPTELEKVEAMKLQVSSSLKSIEEELQDVHTDLRQRLFVLESCNKAHVIVYKSLYPNVSIILNGFRHFNSDELYAVKFAIRNGDISYVNLADSEKK